ncbi:hypothetical protein OK349_02115 [Sphingomonas sp. BT-65]|uniref:hypothetical protein n=1 Tax=Sphingomonas sp. BT-65 TaxID=2989821 RepID=UPI002235DDB8|nr:hypothetical protein [Sphingomonas sp. BT-65]MCW4460485.1 hypothetical protein [Sphingomonas sp. BT-65]
MTQPAWTRPLLWVLLGILIVVRAGPLCAPAAAMTPIAQGTLSESACHDAPAKPQPDHRTPDEARCNSICAPLPAPMAAFTPLIMPPAAPVAYMPPLLTGQSQAPPLPPPRTA